jgi:hypothetical protein
VERTTIAAETEVLGENLPQRHFVPPQIPHDQVRFRTSERSGGKPATDRLSYGVAWLLDLLVSFRKGSRNPNFAYVEVVIVMYVRMYVCLCMCKEKDRKIAINE